MNVDHTTLRTRTTVPLTWSLSPKCVEGGMCRHGDSTVNLTGKMDSSPFFDLPGWPSTPTMSPRLVSLCSAWKAARSSSDLLRGEVQGGRGSFDTCCGGQGQGIVT